MIIHVRKCVSFLRFVCLFVLLSYLLYQVVQTVDRWIEPIHQYDEPDGSGALKAFRPLPATDPDRTPLDRLRWFYWAGG